VARPRRLGLLLLLLFSFTALNVILNFVGRDFMTALAEKNLSDFNRNLLIYLGSSSSPRR